MAKGPQVDGLADLEAMDYSVVQQCMHCGMCLPVCPTYELTKRERHSPRGRIALMRAVADRELDLDQAFSDEMAYCLGCLACQTACPAAVDYAQLFEVSRAASEKGPQKGKGTRCLYRWLSLRLLFRFPRLLRLFGRMTERLQHWRIMDWWYESALFQWLPQRWRRLMRMTPTMSGDFSDALIEPLEEPDGISDYEVGLLTGCVQDIAYAQINRDTVDVLLVNRCTVITPRLQSCCGSIHGHNGDIETAREMARRNIDAFPVDSLDAIITNSGGCGSHLKHYGRLLNNDLEYAERARVWDGKIRDIHEWLGEIGICQPERDENLENVPLRVAYHESCHLSHGQKVVSAPKEVLRSVPGLELIDLPEANWCCGSAGVYSITQPETSDALLARKVAHILSVRPEVVATANPGCDLQLKRGLEEAGVGSITVAAPVSLLASAYRSNKENSFDRSS